MIGMVLSEITEKLFPVSSEEHLETPVVTIPNRMTKKVIAHLDDFYGGHDLAKIGHSLPFNLLQKLYSFDEICKIAYSSIYTMDDSVGKAMDEIPAFTLFKKIKSSMWRWGYRNNDWNSVVRAWNGILAFDLGVEGFETTLDHTRWFHDYGPAEHSETYLDGVFAFLVHYRGEHVMTIGFSVTQTAVLIQQIQLVKRKGNRWLYRYPHNRVEHAVGRFIEAFPEFDVCVASGKDIGKRSLTSYKETRSAIIDRIKRDEKDAKLIERRKLLSEKIKHLTARLPEIEALYSDTGCFQLGDAVKLNGITHYKVAA